MDKNLAKPEMQWWGYKHASGSLQVKRYFSLQDLDEAFESPFCENVEGPFWAEDRDAALIILEQRLKKIGAV